MKVSIITEGASGDEELIEALRRIVEDYDGFGEVSGHFELDDGEAVDWAINPGEPSDEPNDECPRCGGEGIEPAAITSDFGDGEGEDRPCSVCSGGVS